MDDISDSERMDNISNEAEFKISNKEIYPLVQIFESIFSLLKFNNPKGAASYYILLITEKFPSTFETIKSKSKTIPDEELTIGKLKAGREELLHKGITSKIISKEIIKAKNDNENPKMREVSIPEEAIENINRENRKLKSGLDYGILRKEEYLPTCPLTIWTKNKNELKNKMGYGDEEIALMGNRIAKLKNAFNTNFSANGIGTKSGSITILYTKDWILNAVILNMQSSKELLMMLSGLGTFEGEQKNYYNTMLDKGLNIQALFDRKGEKYKERLENINELRKGRESQFQIRFSPIKYATSRRIILGSMAIDARKLLIKSIRSKDISYYIGTIYFESDDINYLKSLFNATWDRGILEKDIEIFQDKIAAEQIEILWKEGLRDRVEIASKIGDPSRRYSPRTVRTWIEEKINKGELKPEG